MFECQNCGKVFEEAIYIDEEARCPHCMSGDVIVYEEEND